jgi:Na+-translocating ferredoxin:NAD+ oxidoreductase subunit G
VKEIIKLSVVTLIFCLVAGGLLALTNHVTKSKIEQVKKDILVSSLRRVLPPCDNNPMEDAVTLSANGKDWTFYIARKSGQYAGVAFRCVSNKGYAGDIGLLVGVNNENRIFGIEVLDCNETPGLGTKIKNPAFIDLFRKDDTSSTKWLAVKQDGGTIDSITGATISSRAVCEATRTGLDVLNANRDKIMAGPADTDKGASTK